MDLVAGKRNAVFGRDRQAVPHGLFRRHFGLDIKQSETRCHSARPLDAERIANRAPEHLIPAADAYDAPATPDVRLQIAVPAGSAQITEVGNRRFRPGQDHQRCIARQPVSRLHEDELDIGLGTQRIEIVEIGDARQNRYGDLQRTGGAPGEALQHDGVLRRQAGGGLQPGHHAETRPSGEAIDRCVAVIEERNIAAELVDDITGNHRPVVIRKDRVRAGKRGDHAATIDIAHEHDWHLGAGGKAHIGDIAGTQLISAGEPAPSTMTRSAPSETIVKLCRTCSRSSGFNLW
ncbi:hypothetical protein AJ87_29860 [Rhizobium yanglingense]|nr:hypothetical protein AJ87_29860 [Rhizobium yanglingense]